MKFLLIALIGFLPLIAMSEEEDFPDRLETLWIVPQSLVAAVEGVGGATLLMVAADDAWNYRMYYGDSLKDARADLRHAHRKLAELAKTCPLQIAINAETELANVPPGQWGARWNYYSGERAKAKDQIAFLEPKVKEFFRAQALFFTVGGYGLIEGATRFYLVCEQRSPGYFPLGRIAQNKAVRTYRVLRTVYKEPALEHSNDWHFSP